MAGDKVQDLVDKGVVIHNPESIYIAEDVDVSLIAADVTIYTGCRIMGAKTVISSGSVLGYEAPVTIENCQLGQSVELRGGFFSDSVFLDGVRFGAQAHVRADSLVEEYVVCGPSVSMKQTVVMPYIMMGSMINFCDCLMAGGTGHDNCSEVGSSYVHFNFSHHQDKATPSLIGDVPRGVLIDQKPIFLGGQGGLVGPVQIAYGTTVAAGTICRRDIKEEGQMMFGASFHRSGVKDHDSELYGDVKYVIRNNISYIGSLYALKSWYSLFRSSFVKNDRLALMCHEAAVEHIEGMIRERISQLDLFAAKMKRSEERALETGHNIDVAPHKLHSLFAQRWSVIKRNIAKAEDVGSGCGLSDAVSEVELSDSYLETVRSLTDQVKGEISAALDRVIAAVVDCSERELNE